MSRTVGVIGGMGPAATALVVRERVAATPARRDQDHLRVLIDSNPAVPDRVEAILHGGPSPAPVLAEMARGLEAQGAELLVMPCNTAHAWEDDVRGAVRIPFISIVTATVDAAQASQPPALRIGVLATTGCLRAGLYQAACGARGLEAVVLPSDRLPGFMSAIATAKGPGVTEAAVAQVRSDVDALADAGADLVLAACTEVPWLLDGVDTPVPVISSSAALARATVRLALSEPVA